MDDNPGVRLREAAELLRATASAATPGPWKVDSSIPYGHRVGSTDDADWVAWTGEHGESQSPEDAAFIALLHPGVALALADWLDAEASYWANVYVGQPMPGHERGLYVAAAILGVELVAAGEG